MTTSPTRPPMFETVSSSWLSSPAFTCGRGGEAHLKAKVEKLKPWPCSQKRSSQSRGNSQRPKPTVSALTNGQLRHSGPHFSASKNLCVRPGEPLVALGRISMDI